MRLAAPLAVLALLLNIQPMPAESGTVRFTPVGDQSEVPDRYRLDAHTFEYQLTPKATLAGAGVEVHRLTFPSPVESPHPENNTVHGEYYRPAGAGPFPGVIVLDILGGDQTLSRSMATYFAQNRVAALFVQMAYYGPRRPAGKKVRLLTPSVPHTLEAVRQTVLDCRRAAAWLEGRPEVDAKRLGIVGTSLGSFMSALTAEFEPRLGNVALLLGGGGLVDAYWNHPKAGPARQALQLLGFSKEALARAIAPADPITHAANLKGRNLLMIAARNDEVVPASAAQALWEASGRQTIHWLDAGHYTAALHLPLGLQQLVRHFTGAALAAK